MSKGYEQRKEANKRYLAKQDELKIRLPGGQKQAVEAHAASKGKSVNGLVNDLLREDMGLSEAQWKTKPTQPDELPDLDLLGELEGNDATGIE